MTLRTTPSISARNISSSCMIRISSTFPYVLAPFPPANSQTRVGGCGCEQFRSNTPINQPEICDTTGVVEWCRRLYFFWRTQCGDSESRMQAISSGVSVFPRSPMGKSTWSSSVESLSPIRLHLKNLMRLSSALPRRVKGLGPGSVLVTRLLRMSTPSSTHPFPRSRQ